MYPNYTLCFDGVFTFWLAAARAHGDRHAGHGNTKQRPTDLTRLLCAGVRARASTRVHAPGRMGCNSLFQPSRTPLRGGLNRILWKPIPTLCAHRRGGYAHTGARFKPREAAHVRAASCARALLLGANSPYKAAPAPPGKTTVAHGANNYWVPTSALRRTLSPIPRALWMSAGREFCAPNTTTRDPKQLLTYNTVWGFYVAPALGPPDCYTTPDQPPHPGKHH